jgi:type I pantothenate kinase
MQVADNRVPVAPLDATGFEVFSRAEWTALASRPGSALSASDVAQLAATGEPISSAEVTEVYLPLAQFLAVLVANKRTSATEVDAFLRHHPGHAPFIIGIAGSVAVGKSTTARVVQALLRQDPAHPTVDLLTTDGFLYPNAILEERGLMHRKGFPESYDQRSLLRALADLRAGVSEVATPMYSHLAYDIIPGEFQHFHRPDIVIVEGLNVLQVPARDADPTQVVASDYFDFSLYVDATEAHIAQWFEERLLVLSSTVLQAPDSFFHRFSSLSDGEVLAIARQVWADINSVNLHENIAPTRSRAHLVLEKDSRHAVQRVLLRRP